MSDTLQKTIDDLEGEKIRIERALVALRAIQAKALDGKSRRGRKSMSREERIEVSDRMKKYWRDRRGAA